MNSKVSENQRTPGQPVEKSVKSRLDDSGYDRKAKAYHDSSVKTQEGKWGSSEVYIGNNRLKQIDELKMRYKQMYEV